MPTKTKVMSLKQITYLVDNAKKAHKINSDDINLKKIKRNPAIRVLSGVEKNCFLLYLAGMMHQQIADILKMTRCQVTRLVNLVKEKLRYLFRFRKMLETEPEYSKKFYTHGLPKFLKERVIDDNISDRRQHGATFNTADTDTDSDSCDKYSD